VLMLMERRLPFATTTQSGGGLGSRGVDVEPRTSPGMLRLRVGSSLATNLGSTVTVDSPRPEESARVASSLASRRIGGEGDAETGQGPTLDSSTTGRMSRAEGPTGGVDLLALLS